MTRNDTNPVRKPLPAHDTERSVALPWRRPKAEQEDAAAPELVATITAHPTYIEADRDVGFLNQDENRGVRLQLDYQKTECLLRAEGIAHTIVVFGGTRIAEPAAAAARVSALEAELQVFPEDADLDRKLSIARRLLDKTRYYVIARDLGRIVAASEGEHGNRLVVVTGGGPGIMEAANRGAQEAGARTVGLNITLPQVQYPNPYVTPGLCFRLRYFALRKLHFMKRARALVVFPGGFGTLDELFETLTLIQTRKIRPVPVILVGRAYWSRVFDADFLVDEGVIDAEDRELFWFAEEAQEIWDDITRWYARAGRTVTNFSAERITT